MKSEVLLTLSIDPSFSLRAHYAFPNPARGTNPTIRVQLGLADSVKVDIYNILGRVIHSATFPAPRVLDDGNGKGEQYTYDYTWNAGRVGSSIYLYVITATKAGEAPVSASGKVGVLR